MITYDLIYLYEFIAIKAIYKYRQLNSNDGTISNIT